jgi:hypothetical protein
LGDRPQRRRRQPVPPGTDERIAARPRARRRRVNRISLRRQLRRRAQSRHAVTSRRRPRRSLPSLSSPQR